MLSKFSFSVALGDNVFDPLLIIIQIILMQTSFYIHLGLLLFILNLITGSPGLLHLDQFFSYKAMSIWTIYGWVTITSWLLTSLTGATLLFFIVKRSKKCLDFTATLFILHFFVCVFYKAFPVHLEWWGCMVIGMILMAALGEYLCYRREIYEIPILAPSLTSSTRSDHHPSSAGTNKNEYEMLNQNDPEGFMDSSSQDPTAPPDSMIVNVKSDEKRE